MKKRTIVGLVILMGISLLGIIAVQFYWFNNSVRVRNELFDRSVNEAMNKAVRRLEMGHDLKIIRNFTSGDSTKWDERMNFPPPPPLPDSEDMDVIIKKDSVAGRLTVIASRGGKPKKGIHSINVRTFVRDSHHHKRDTKDPDLNRRDLIVTNTDSVVVSEYPGDTNKIRVKIDQLKKFSRQIAIEYKGWELGRQFDENQLKRVLSEELVNRAIPIGFDYFISPSDSSRQTGSKLTDRTRWYKVNLFPDDIFRKNVELAISFPERNLFIGRSTNLLLGLSVIFSLVIFLTFSLSLFLILRQKKISEIKSDFINNMTHEFKTPIATISIASDSILNKKVIKDEERVRFFAGMIRKENIRMNEQVERILQIARLEKKEFEFNFQPVNVHELIGEAIEGISLQVEKKGGHIIAKLNAGNPVVTTDPIHFINLIYNLLDNANKYSPETPLITVATTNTPKGLIISVEDQGIGMSKTVQARIFDKFYRLPSGNIHNIKGFGLGLSYVKAILEINGGTIKVSSEPGKGSRFLVFIPFLMSK